jgi:predicted TIM-barrel fold metal-dependent hydrolase
MKNYPNLHGDLSAKSGFNAISRDPEFGYRFMEEFSDRLYFGTDIASTPQELPIVDYFNTMRREKILSEEILDKISWKNAFTLLRLS